jgi:hypothetical protein
LLRVVLTGLWPTPIRWLCHTLPFTWRQPLLSSLLFLAVWHGWRLTHFPFHTTLSIYSPPIPSPCPHTLPTPYIALATLSECLSLGTIASLPLPFFSLNLSTLSPSPTTSSHLTSLSPFSCVRVRWSFPPPFLYPIPFSPFLGNLFSASATHLVGPRQPPLAFRDSSHLRVVCGLNPSLYTTHTNNNPSTTPLSRLNLTSQLRCISATHPIPRIPSLPYTPWRCVCKVLRFLPVARSSGLELARLLALQRFSHVQTQSTETNARTLQQFT